MVQVVYADKLSDRGNGAGVDGQTFLTLHKACKV